jgi:tetratricopeptide (TPR) repeat protein/CHAT domain-containing protein
MDQTEEQAVAEINERIEQGRILVQQQNLGRAIEVLDRALEVAKKRLAPPHALYCSLIINLADCHLGLENYENAESTIVGYLDQLTANADPQIVEQCRNLLANIYLRTLRWTEAQAILRKSIEERSKRLSDLHPSQIPDHYLLLVSYLKVGRIQEARALLPRMAQMRASIPPGLDDSKGLAEMVSQAFGLLGVPADQPDSDTTSVPPHGQRQDDGAFYGSEVKCWREFVNRDFDAAALSALELLVERATLRLLEIRLLSLLWLGASTESDAEKALAVLPGDGWERSLVEFTLGRIPFDTVLRVTQDGAEVSQSYFYAGMRALHEKNEEQAREYFQKALDSEGETPEKAQSAHELDGLRLLACDISEFSSKKQSQIQQAYRKFALLDYQGVLEFTLRLRDESLTPQLLLLRVVSLRALGRSDLADDFIPHARRQLLRWPWHERLLKLLMAGVPAQSFLPAAQDDVQVCQLHYYAMAEKRVVGHWEEAALHREAALKAQAHCPERKLAALDASDTAAMIRNANGQLGVLIGCGQLAMAEQVGRAALAAARRCPPLDPKILPTTLSNLASIAGMQENLAESMRLFDELDTISGGLQADDQFAHALNRGQLYLDHGLRGEAQRFLVKALEIGRSVDLKPHMRVALCNALGKLASESGAWDESIRWYEEANSALGNDPSADPLLRAIITDNLGVSFSQKRCYPEALAQHTEAYRVLSAATAARGGHISDSHPSLCKILTNWSWVLARLGQYAEAETRANAALRITGATVAAMDNVRNSALTQLAMIFAASGRPAEALEKLVQASALRDKELGQMMALSSDELRMGYVSGVRFELGMLLTLAGRNFQEDSERIESVFDVVLRRKALVAEAASVRRDAVLGGRYPRLRLLLDEWRSLQSRIAALVLGSAADVRPEKEADIALLQERSLQLEANLTKEIPELQLDIELRKVRARPLLRRLPVSWSVVEFVRAPLCNLMLEGATEDAPFSEECYWAFVIPSADLHSLTLVDLGPAGPIDQAVAAFLGRLGDPPNQRAPSIQDIREMLVKPVFSILPRAGHILVVPEGSLARLPFEVLPDAEGRYQIDSHSFSYLATCRDLARMAVSGQSEPSQDVVVADPDFDRSPGPSHESGAKTRQFLRLPGTLQEGKVVAGLLGVHPWLGADANEKRIRQLSSPRILHLATHGFFDESPREEVPAWNGSSPALRSAAVAHRAVNPLLRSGLAFAGANCGNLKADDAGDVNDGLLTAAEVTSMNLVGTELVVLSACDTGLGSIHATEGAMGLRRAFQLAGARSVIASLWKLPDQQTCELMKGFYRRITNGIPRGEALRAAQMEQRRSFPSPFYWGALVCFGDIAAVRGMENVGGNSAETDGSSSVDVRASVRKFSLLIQADPSNSEALLRRGICYHNLGLLADAVADFDRAAGLAPGVAEVLFSRGFALHRLHRFEDALKDFDRALALKPDYARAFHRRGNTFAALGNPEAALKDLTRATQLIPDDAGLLYDRAGFLADQKSFSEALDDYSHAISLRPSFQIAYVNRATVLMELGKIEEAIRDLETATQLDPDDALAHLNLGSAYASNGYKEKALESWEQAASLGNAELIRAARKMQAALFQS